MLPFRAIAEALNLEVDWEAEQQIVCVKGDNLLIEMQVGNRQAQVNAQPKNLDSPGHHFRKNYGTCALCE